MTTLYTISSSWHTSTNLFEQLAYAQYGDAILLIQDAVLAVHSDITLASFIAKCSSANISVYVLQEDCELRGVVNKHNAIKAINYAGFVELAALNEKQVAW